MTNTPHDDTALREELAKAIWQVHSDNPREHILDGVMALISQKIIEAESKYYGIVSTMERQVAHGNGLDQWQIEELLATLTTKQDAKEK